MDWRIEFKTLYICFMSAGLYTFNLYIYMPHKAAGVLYTLPLTLEKEEICGKTKPSLVS